jgi:hypothetical protein
MEQPEAYEVARQYLSIILTEYKGTPLEGPAQELLARVDFDQKLFLNPRLGAGMAPPEPFDPKNFVEASCQGDRKKGRQSKLR